MPKTYKIGTRGSLLALTQCQQVKDQLEILTGDSFELKILKTQGDENTEVPLWQLDGKDFFTKELDHALQNGSVDLVVHSYKDLGSERPSGIQLAAITKRSFPEDVLLFRNNFLSNCQQKKKIIIGTSSPRRITNLTSGLSEYLPGSNHVETKVLRGNINTRIQKLLDRDNHYDAICLALAGVERLANSKKSSSILKELVKDLSFMILPPSIFPPAASQGALAIECLALRNDNQELLNKLQKLHDFDTYEEVSREREAFVSYGGGCHLAVGVHVKKWQGHFIHTHKGVIDQRSIDIHKIESQENKKLNLILEKYSYQDLFLGSSPQNPIKEITEPYLQDQIITKKSTPIDISKITEPIHLYVTSVYCQKGLKEILNKKGHLIRGIFTSGASSMKKILSDKYPIHLCADSHGDHEINKFLNSNFLQLILKTSKKTKMIVLTNNLSESSLGETIPCYTREIGQDSAHNLKNKIESKKIFYWTSFYQYQKYLELFPGLKDKDHLCGLGKTFKEFNKRNIKVYPIGLRLLIKKLNPPTK